MSRSSEGIEKKFIGSRNIYGGNGVCDIEDPSIGALEISVLFGQPAWLEAESYFKHEVCEVNFTSRCDNGRAWDDDVGVNCARAFAGS
uniref:Uncharacterized protein n=1 Tax=Vespula pensylvanica TaxID=30213 RepID=A0A834N399_VESPE|nr:hypothetical protein H0235_016830 [Vespula pensylvanica]